MKRQGQQKMTRRKEGLGNRRSAKTKGISRRSGRRTHYRRRPLPRRQREGNRNHKGRCRGKHSLHCGKGMAQRGSRLRPAQRRNSRKKGQRGVTGRRRKCLFPMRAAVRRRLQGMAAGHRRHWAVHVGTSHETRHSGRRSGKCGRNEAGRVMAFPKGRRGQDCPADQKDSEKAGNHKFEPPQDHSRVTIPADFRFCSRIAKKEPEWSFYYGSQTLILGL